MKILVWVIFGSTFNSPYNDVMFDTQERCVAVAKRIGPSYYCEMIVKIVPVLTVAK